MNSKSLYKKKKKKRSFSEIFTISHQEKRSKTVVCDQIRDPERKLMQILIICSLRNHMVEDGVLIPKEKTKKAKV